MAYGQNASSCDPLKRWCYVYLDIFRVSKDSFGNKLIKSLNDHPWYVVLIFCIDIYYILKMCVIIVLLWYAE